MYTASIHALLQHYKFPNKLGLKQTNGLSSTVSLPVTWFSHTNSTFERKLIIFGQFFWVLFCWVFSRFFTYHYWWVSSHSKGRCLQQHNATLLKRKKEEQEAGKRKQTTDPTASDSGTYSLTWCRRCNILFQSWRTYSESKQPSHLQTMKEIVLFK